MKYIILVTTTLTTFFSFAQEGSWDYRDSTYKVYLRAKKLDTALLLVRQMNSWALVNETDTSLHYASSLRDIGVVFYRMKELDTALLYTSKAYNILQAQNRTHHKAYTSTLNNLAVFYKESGDYERSEEFCAENVKIKRNIYGDQDNYYAKSLNSHGIISKKLKKYDQAEALYIEALEIYRKNYGSEHSKTKSVLTNLGTLYNSTQKYEQAESIFIELLELSMKQDGPTHSNYAKCSNSLGLVYRKMEKYEKAETLYTAALKIYKEELGEEHSTYIAVLNNLGSVYYSASKYDQAEDCFVQVLEIGRRNNKTQNITFATSLRYLGRLYSNKGNYEEGEKLLKEALEIFKHIVGSMDSKYAGCLLSLGRLYKLTGKYELAEASLIEALQVYAKFNDRNNYGYAEGSNLLGGLYSRLGRYQQAESFYYESLNIYKYFGQENSSYATTLGNLGLLHSKMGKYNDAEIRLLESLKIKQNILGDEHIKIAISLTNIAGLYQKIGKYNKAETYYLRSLEIYKNNVGAIHKDYAQCLNNLAILYKYQKKYDEAESLMIQVLETYKQTIGIEHIQYAQGLNNLGGIYCIMRKYKKAEPLLLEALEIKKKTTGIEHDSYAVCLNDLAYLYKMTKEYQKAEPLLVEAASLKEKTLGSNHPSYARGINNLATFYVDMGNNSKAQEHYEIVYSIKLNNLKNNFSWLSRDEKEAYWDLSKKKFANLNTFASITKDELPSSLELAYNSNLVSKSLLLETSRELNQAIKQSPDSALRNTYYEMKAIQKTYGKLQSDGFPNQEYKTNYKNKIDSLDKILTKSLGEYASSKQKFEITWKDIRKNLKRNEAAIEFARYYDRTDKIYKYLALVVRKGYKHPKLCLLGSEEEIKELDTRYNNSELYSLIWSPIDTLLTGVKTVYYSPSGFLNNVAFSSLQLPAKITGDLIEDFFISEEYLIDKYTLHQLTTTRFIADGTLNHRTTMTPSISLYGGIDYDAIPGEPRISEVTIDNDDYLLTVNLKERNSRANSKMSYLKFTKDEVENIQDILDKRGWNSSLYLGPNAMEVNFKNTNETSSSGVLHIATHGFAFPDIKENTEEIYSEESIYRASNNPMVRCGLLLTGGNWAWTGSDTLAKLGSEENGILTAAEISTMNLSNTKLVVLSACETGLGKIEGTEGTFGLTRGFKLAGVEQLIVSLWPVPDKETMELMTYFYSDLAETNDPEKSFRKAQIHMRKEYGAQTKNWAGFVLIR